VTSSAIPSNRPIRIAINGFGRIGELVFRNLVHRDLADRVQVVAVNDVIPLDQIIYLLRFDTVHRTPEADDEIESGPGWLRVNDHEVRIFQERDPANLPWAELGVDIVVDATGVFRDREGLSKHLTAGARKVVLTAPARGDGADVTLCLGVNHEDYDPEHHHLVSNASCTTNCLAPVARCIDEAFGIEWGVMSTIHAYTGSQALIDQADSRPRRGRAAAWNIVPSTTGAAQAIGLVLPRLAGKIQGMAFRVPVPDGSCIDFTVGTREPLNETTLHAAMAAAEQDPSFRGVLSITEDELVSSDILGSSRSAIVEAPSTLVVGEKVVKVVAWYDNEWGYASRVVDLVDMMAESM
jgi:glyceraldehyde 3-phosphate dehydrogenase